MGKPRNRSYVIPSTASDAVDRHDAVIDDSVDEFAATAQYLFNNEYQGIAQLLDSFRDADLSDDEVQAALARLVGDLRAGAYRDQWYQRFHGLLQNVMEIGGEGVAASVGFDFLIQNPEVQNALDARASTLSDLVGRTTANQILAQFAGVRSVGGTTGDLTKALAANVFGLSSGRARTIARTESGIAYNRGQFLSAKLSGVVTHKIWYHSGVSDHPRDWHEDMDGETVEIDDTFSNDLDHAGDPDGDPEEIINCGCTNGYTVLG